MFPLPQGIPRLTDYDRLRRSAEFAAMRCFSNDFLSTHREQLRGFRRSWVADPLNQWSRTWEYPFVVGQLERFAGGRPSLEILDAGSGITFFPFFVADRLRAHVRCTDADTQLTAPFRAIVSQTGLPVTYQCGDIRALDMEDATVDAVVCISVLEHTERYREITAEFLRVLRPGGLLVLSFDISPGGSADIAPRRAADLLQAVTALTDPFGDPSADVETLDQVLGDMTNCLTTTWARAHRPDALPWRFPVLSALKASVPHGRLRTFIDLTCFCCARTKPVPRAGSS